MNKERANSSYQLVVPFKSQNDEMADLKERIDRIISSPDIPTEIKEQLKSNNLIQTIEKYFNLDLVERGTN